MRPTPAERPKLPGDAADTFAALERRLLARRERPPDMASAVAEALEAACGGPPPAGPSRDAALAIARAVEAHGASFPPGAEPAYHDRHHQAEATLAMGWLCGLARRDAALDADAAALGVAAMAGHDLGHRGDRGGPPGLIEEQSARAAAALAARAGASPEWCDALAAIVRATEPGARQGDAALPLLHRLAREADLLGSTLPRLGQRLSRALAAEWRAGGVPDGAIVGTHAARLRFLRALPALTTYARSLGMGLARDGQLDAYALVARRLGAGATAEDGALALDALGRERAAPLFDAALAEVGLSP